MNKEKNVFIAPGAVCLGNISIGEESSVWYHATLRADKAIITIGSRTNIQDNAVVHVDEGHSVSIGDNVTIGHGAIVHGCTIGNNTLIGMGAIVLNGAKIGKNCVIGAGALVTQNAEIPDDSLAVGSPAKIRRQVSGEEAAENLKNAEEYVEEAKRYAKMYQ